MSPSEPIFRPVFGDAWDSLPPAIRKHYANRADVNERITVDGHLDIACSPLFCLFRKLHWWLGNVPPVNEKNVPVTVHFDSKEGCDGFYFNRIFHFKDRKPYTFRSCMRRQRGSDVVEIMNFGICWKVRYGWENGKVILSHRGFGIRILGYILPLPITVLVGKGEAEEIALSDDAFAMQATLTHSLWGKLYEYKGRFAFREQS